MDVRRTFRPDPTSAGEARRFVAEALSGLAFDIDCAQLLANELVTNAVRHAGTDIQVAVSIDGNDLLVSVEDGDARVPEVQAVAPEVETGRGLFLVARLAQAWGIDPTTSGKRVWFRLGVL